MVAAGTSRRPYTKNMLDPDVVSANQAVAAALEYITGALHLMESYEDDELLEDLMDLQEDCMNVQFQVQAKLVVEEVAPFTTDMLDFEDDDDFEE